VQRLHLGQSKTAQRAKIGALRATSAKGVTTSDEAAFGSRPKSRQRSQLSAIGEGSAASGMR